MLSGVRQSASVLLFDQIALVIFSAEDKRLLGWELVTGRGEARERQSAGEQGVSKHFAIYSVTTAHCTDKERDPVYCL